MEQPIAATGEEVMDAMNVTVWEPNGELFFGDDKFVHSHQDVIELRGAWRVTVITGVIYLFPKSYVIRIETSEAYQRRKHIEEKQARERQERAETREAEREYLNRRYGFGDR